jgi:uncharacterized protein YjbI with pentapeptide repeats
MLKFAYVKGSRNMKRAEALKHFEEEYTMPYYMDMDEDMDKYIDENRKGLTASFIENFRILCKKIKEMQDKGKKGKIAYIIYSFNIQNLQKESRDYVVQAYGTEWFLEEGEECKIKYGVGWIYDFLDNTYGKLADISKKYIGNINSADLDSVWKDGIKYCDVRLLNFAKKAIKEAILIDEFKAIDKEEVLEIRLGEHKGYNEIIYKMDTRVKDSKEIKYWLESREKSYSCSILQNLDLSNGDYKGITCHNSDFSGSDLSNSTFEGASLLESVFVKSVIKGVDFKKSKLSESDFHDTTIEDSNFEESHLRDSDFHNSEITGCKFLNTRCHDVNFSNCTFKNNIFKNVKFGRANFENSDLRGNDLKGSSFIATNLKNADLSNADLTGVEFVGIDFTKFKFENSIFKNNKIKEIKIFAKDVYRLNITEEQRKELTIIV